MSRMGLFWCWRFVEQDGTIDNDRWESAVAGPNGSSILAGYTEENWAEISAGGYDFAALSLDAAGIALWSYQVRAFC